MIPPQGLELYSTVLWHLKRETDLAHLAQEALATDRLAPQTWWAAALGMGCCTAGWGCVSGGCCLCPVPPMSAAAGLRCKFAACAARAPALERRAPPPAARLRCVVGNCFSLQRDPAAAVAFFKRAMQLDPGFAYAATLAGARADRRRRFPLTAPTAAVARGAAACSSAGACRSAPFTASARPLLKQPSCKITRRHSSVTPSSVVYRH